MPTIMMLGMSNHWEGIGGLKRIQASCSLFKVHFVCCSLFILAQPHIHFPHAALASSASLCDELSFQQLWLLPIFFPELQKPHAYLLRVFFHCGGVLVGHSNTLPSSFLLLFIAQQSTQPPAKHVTVNTMECRSCFRPIKWLVYPWFQATSNNSWKRTQTTLLFTSILVIFISLFCVFWVLFVCFFFHVLAWLKINLLKCNRIVCAYKRMKLCSLKNMS